jgi:hypothetical protein
MSIKKSEIETIKKVFEYLEQNFGTDSFEDGEDLSEDDEFIYFPFPKEADNIEINVEYLLVYFNEINSFKIHDNNKVTTDTITQRVITTSEYIPVEHLDNLKITTAEGIELCIVASPILIGIAATKNDEYSKYNPPCSSHICVEVKYPNKKSRLSNEDEENLLKSYFFELSHSYKLSVSFSTFKHSIEFDEEFVGDSKRLPNDIDVYNHGMELFNEANESLSPDLKFLAYYKIFEYFAPFVSKIEAFKAMRKKLDSSNINNLNGDFIASIFDLSKSYENSLRDKELVKAIIDETFDLIDIYSTIPKSIRKQTKVEKLEYNTKNETKEKVINHIGNVLYTTRNNIVHAKSNFNSTGLECSGGDLVELNDFMHKACYSTIKWYNRLPSHLKIT